MWQGCQSSIATRSRGRSSRRGQASTAEVIGSESGPRSACGTGVSSPAPRCGQRAEEQDGLHGWGFWGVFTERDRGESTRGKGVKGAPTKKAPTGKRGGAKRSAEGAPQAASAGDNGQVADESPANADEAEREVLCECATSASPRAS